jgi:hypothetical protein
MQRRWGIFATLAAAALMAGLGTTPARAGTIYTDVHSAGPAEANLFYKQDITNGAAVAANAIVPTGTTESILEHLSAAGGALAGATFTRLNDIPPVNDQLWQFVTGNTGTALITARFAGDVSQFGTAAPNAPAGPGNFTPAFDGSNNPLFIVGSGYNATFNTAADGSGTSTTTATFTGSNPFAFALHDTNGNPANNKFYSSVQALNADGNDHMVTFQVTNADGSSGGYLLAFEDRSVTNGTDFDHNDAVIQVQGVTPTPEPATMIMALTALPALGLARKLRKREATA